MYYYLAYRGRTWNPAETLVVFATIERDYVSGVHVTPAETEDFDGLTIVAPLDALSVVEAINRGPIAMYSNFSKSLIMEQLSALIWEGLE